MREILACRRAAELLNPKRGSVLRTCDRCKEPIWVMAINLQLPMPKMCHQCVEAEGIDEDIVEHMPARDARDKYL